MENINYVFPKMKYILFQFILIPSPTHVAMHTPLLSREKGMSGRTGVE